MERGVIPLCVQYLMKFDKKENYLLPYIFCASATQMWSQDDGSVKIEYCPGTFEQDGIPAPLHPDISKQEYVSAVCPDCGKSKLVLPELWDKAVNLRDRILKDVETPVDMAEVLDRMGKLSRQCPKNPKGEDGKL